MEQLSDESDFMIEYTFAEAMLFSPNMFTSSLRMYWWLFKTHSWLLTVVYKQCFCLFTPVEIGEDEPNFDEHICLNGVVETWNHQLADSLLMVEHPASFTLSPGTPGRLMSLWLARTRGWKKTAGGWNPKCFLKCGVHATMPLLFGWTNDHGFTRMMMFWWAIS